MSRSIFRIISINAKGVTINRKPHTRREKSMLEQALAAARNMALDEMMMKYLKEQAEEYERYKAVYPKGYCVNRAPWK